MTQLKLVIRTFYFTYHWGNVGYSYLFALVRSQISSGESAFRNPEGAVCFVFSKSVHTDSGAHPTFSTMCTGAFSQGYIGHLPQHYSAEVENGLLRGDPAD